MARVSLADISSPKQWPTIPMVNFTKVGYPVYGANGRIGFYTEYNHVKPTILITCRGATCGELNICEPFSYVTGNAMALDDLNEEKVDLKFLYYTLAHRGLQDAITGSAQPQITRDKLLLVDIRLPSLPEQKSIVNILKNANRLRWLRRYALELSDTYLQSVFLEMFGDPVKNPTGWPIVTLGEIGKLDRGRSKHRPRNAPELYGGPYPFIQTGDVANAAGYVRKYSQTYSAMGLEQSKLWPSGTMCITIAANIAKTAIVTFDACFPDSIVGFTPNERTNVEFIQHWFSFMQCKLEDTAPESAQKNINLEILRKLDIALSPKPMQEQFANIVEKHERLRSQQREAQHQAEHLFHTLLHRAFRGQLASELVSL